MRVSLKAFSIIFLIQIAVMANGISSICQGFYGSGAVGTQINKYNELITELSRLKPSDVNAAFKSQSWSCNTNACVEMSGQLNFALKKLQMPVQRIGVNSSFVLNVPGLPRGAFHYFVIDPSIPGHEIIIDPTYKQFFNRPIPEADIFVGTREQLEDLFVRYHTDIKLPDGDSALKMDSKGIVEAYYGYGRGEKTKYNTPSRSN